MLVDQDFLTSGWWLTRYGVRPWTTAALLRTIVSDTPESKTLRRAAKVFGGVTALSHWLKVPADSLHKWINGEELPPKAICQQAADIVHGPAKKLKDATPSGVGTGTRILIAHAERDALVTLGILLRSEGFDVRLVQGGAEVAYNVREFRPHAILLDLGMPERSGYEVASDLTQRYGDARPVLIAITQSGESDWRAAEVCGFHHHISKPYDPDELLSLLASLRH